MARAVSVPCSRCLYFLKLFCQNRLLYKAIPAVIEFQSSLSMRQMLSPETPFLLKAYAASAGSAPILVPLLRICFGRFFITQIFIQSDHTDGEGFAFFAGLSKLKTV